MDFHRQLDILSPRLLDNARVIMVGCGGIGSPTVLALVKMGVRDLTVFDPDTVENHNLPNQLFGPSDLGKSKVSAMADLCRLLAGVEIKTFQESFPGAHKPQGIIISGVDSMEARQPIWKALRLKPNVELYIDGRMGGEVARIYTVRPYDPDDIAFYEDNLYSEDEADHLPCTARAIIYNVFAIAALIANQLKKHIKGESYQREVVFDLRNMIFMGQE